MEVFGLEEGVEEVEFLRSKDFLIISCRANISFLCFVCIASRAAMMVDVTALAIDCSTAGSIEL